MNERIAFTPLSVPGVTALQVRSSRRLWSYVHEQLCITVVRGGTGRWKARGHYHDISKSSLMVMGVGEFHATTAVHDRASFDALFISPSLVSDWFHETLPGAGRPAMLRSSVATRSVVQAFRSLLPADDAPVDASGLTEKLLRALSGLFQASTGKALSCAPDCEPRMLQARERIIEEYRREPNTRIDIQDVARSLGVDYFWLVRRFSEHFHVSPYQYVKAVRAARARELLLKGPSADLPTLAAVGRRAGFYDYAHMIRDMRLHLGVSPAELAARVGGWRSRVGRSLPG